LVLLLLALPALGQTAPPGGEKSGLGSIHGTLTTTQADGSGGLAGISVQLAAKGSEGNPLSVETDDSGHFEFKDIQPVRIQFPFIRRDLRHLPKRWK
jgi:hypothetical protein